MTPEAWRASKNLSVPDAARLVGLTGKNPARTWKRWETGERSPSLEQILRVETISEGAVSVESWAQARRDFLSKVNAAASPLPGDIAAHAGASSPDPIPETSESPEPVRRLDADAA